MSMLHHSEGGVWDVTIWTNPLFSISLQCHQPLPSTLSIPQASRCTGQYHIQNCSPASCSAVSGPGWWGATASPVMWTDVTHSSCHPLDVLVMMMMQEDCQVMSRHQFQACWQVAARSLKYSCTSCRIAFVFIWQCEFFKQWNKCEAKKSCSTSVWLYYDWKQTLRIVIWLFFLEEFSFFPWQYGLQNANLRLPLKQTKWKNMAKITSNYSDMNEFSMAVSTVLGATLVRDGSLVYLVVDLYLHHVAFGCKVYGKKKKVRLNYCKVFFRL